VKHLRPLAIVRQKRREFLQIWGTRSSLVLQISRNSF